MVLGIHRKPQKKPDLSRYDYYYQRDEQDGGQALSAAAAGAAGRSRSLVQHRTRTSVDASGSSQNRSYSLRHPSTGAGARKRATGGATGALRTNSLVGVPGVRRRAAGPGSANTSRTNSLISPTGSITVRTTHVKDPMGRTQSITRQTVRKINGYEYVETTTTTTAAAAAVDVSDPEKHFDEFTTDFTHDDIGSHTLAGTLEEEEEEEEEVEEEEDGSEYIDARDFLPSKATSGVQNKATVPRKPVRTRQHRQTLTEQEQYAKALAAAERKVYGDRLPKSSTMGALDSAAKGGRKSRRLSSLRDPPVPAVAVPTAEVGTPKKTTHKTVVHTEDRAEVAAPIGAPRRLNDDELYAKALEIAQKKYASTSAPTATGVIETPAYEREVPNGIPAPRARSKSRVKTFFNRVAQFSQENYGYQGKKDNTHSELGPGLKNDTEPQRQYETKTDAKQFSEPELGQKLEPRPDPGVDREPDLEPKLEPVPELEPAPKPNPGSNSQPQLNPQLISQPEQELSQETQAPTLQSSISNVSRRSIRGSLNESLPNDNTSEPRATAPPQKLNFLQRLFKRSR